METRSFVYKNKQTQSIVKYKKPLFFLNITLF